MELSGSEGPAFGADIGGTAIKVGRLDGVARREFEIPTEPRRGAKDLADRLVAAWRELGAHSAPGLPHVRESFGVGCAGLVDPRGGIIVTSANLPGWDHEPLATLIERQLGARPALMNDANAFVLAEARMGAGRAVDAHATIFGLAIGTGVGGGLVLEGELYEGRRGFAGEPGHMAISLDGPACACGARGCLEAMIGTRAILARYLEHGGSVELAATPAAIAGRAQAGDSIALRVWRETGEILGRGLVALAHLLDPDLLIVGGGVARAGELLLAPAREAFARDVMIPERLRPPIMAAELSNSAGWIGAAFRGSEAAR